MIDLVALVGLFVEVFGTSKNWKEPSIARFDHLEDAKKEKVVHDLEAAGHQFLWKRATEGQLRQLKREGWMPVVERDKFRRPTIFMDSRKELVLVHRPPQN
jgi:hypothetical protein